MLQSWWALAAGVVLAAGGGVFVRHSSSRSRLAALAREAAGDHQNCAVKFNLAERPIPLEEAGRRYGAPYAALATFEPPAVDGPLELLERHACVYQGRRFGHVVFRYRGALTSLLVTDGAPPAAPELEPSDVGPRRGVAAGRTLPRIHRRRSRSPACLAPGADPRGTAVATPRLIQLAVHDKPSLALVALEYFVDRLRTYSRRRATIALDTRQSGMPRRLVVETTTHAKESRCPDGELVQCGGVTRVRRRSRATFRPAIGAVTLAVTMTNDPIVEPDQGL